MKIKSIEAMKLRIPGWDRAQAPGRRPPWTQTFRSANPMSKYPEKTAMVPARWEPVWVKITAEDGTFGLGRTDYGDPVAAIINHHFAPLLQGEDCFAIEKCWDLMFRATRAYGAGGLTSYAISAVDLALWDLSGKLLDKPVYDLIGGKVRDRIPCYVTGNDVDWNIECGFQMFKLSRPFGPFDGVDAIDRTEEYIAGVREQIGPRADLMLDCWMSFDVDFTVRLAERLRPYRMSWLEEYLGPEDLDGHVEVRKRIPWQTLASGEHFPLRYPFQQYIQARCLDILQADIHWVGGLSECIKIGHLAEAAGLPFFLHTGANDQFGLHLAVATSNMPLVEWFMGTPPGVPLEATIGPDAQAFNYRWPAGRSVPKDGFAAPVEGAGFGLGIEEAWLAPYFG